MQNLFLRKKVLNYIAPADHGDELDGFDPDCDSFDHYCDKVFEEDDCNLKDIEETILHCI